MKLFDKYQYPKKDVIKRGYTSHCVVRNKYGVDYWVKWILGIKESGAVVSQISDELRRLQKAKHDCLPDILDYGYDSINKGYAIVLDKINNSDTLFEKAASIDVSHFFDGVLTLVDCLSYLNQKLNITHGDLTPENILIDGNREFYLIDIGLSDMAKNLSQERSLQVFAKEFAAPEKFQPHKAGFAYQSDVYSIGKIIHWFLKQDDLLEESHNSFFDQLLSEDPAERPTYPDLKKLITETFDEHLTKWIRVAFRNGHYQRDIFDLLQTQVPRFDVYPSKGDNIMLDIMLGHKICRGVLWLLGEDKFLFNEVEDVPQNVQSISHHFKKVQGKLHFTNNYGHYCSTLTPLLGKWQEEKQQLSLTKKKLRSVEKELQFYSELLSKELDVIRKAALTLQFEKLEEKSGDLLVTLTKASVENTIGLIEKYVASSGHFDSDPVEFYLSSSSGRNRNDRKRPNGFSGKPIKFDSQKRLLRISDCEGVSLANAPKNGWLLEDTSTLEEEKNRQLEAIDRVNRQNVLNPNLLYYLFKPNELDQPAIDFTVPIDVQQTDDKGVELEYSFNQKKAILTALEAEPFSVIQGPPGTGKTTVITEIVFQLLKRDPGAKILITSQTNSAVDQVLENLLNNEIPICRLTGVSKPLEILRPHTLNQKLSGWKAEVRKSAKANISRYTNATLEGAHPLSMTVCGIFNSTGNWEKKRDDLEVCFYRFPDLADLHHLPSDREEAIVLIDKVLGTNLTEADSWSELHTQWLTAVGSLDENSSVYNKLIDSIRVFGATCNHIGAKRYKRYNFDFDYVIMDESGKATVAESLVPITLGKKLVFVGDHRQLRPMLTANKEVSDWLKKKQICESTDFDGEDEYLDRPSLFEMVIGKDIEYKTQLTECRRSSEYQVRLTSKCFYEAYGDEKIHPVPRPVDREHNLPLKIESSVFFIDIGSTYRNQKDSKRSSFNEVSIEVVKRLLEELNKYEKVKEYDFGVITGYTAQMNRLKSKVGTLKKQIQNVSGRSGANKLTVSVFDRFQGLERDIVIVDLVRSGPGASLGFMEVPNRVNVALSRQKKLLFIVGDYCSLVSAKTHRVKGKAALQNYLMSLKKDWIVDKQNLTQIF